MVTIQLQTTLVSVLKKWFNQISFFFQNYQKGDSQQKKKNKGRNDDKQNNKMLSIKYNIWLDLVSCYNSTFHFRLFYLFFLYRFITVGSLKPESASSFF